MNRFRGWLLLAIAVLTLWLEGQPARAATTGVDEVGTSFEPSQVDIAVNGQVVWTNRSTESHTVTFERNPPGDLHQRCDPATPMLLRTGCQAPRSTVAFTFTTPGTYAYGCKLHPSMRGVVVVGPAASTSSATTSTTLPRATTTSSTVKASTSSTTATTRALATSSTLASSSTTSTTANNTSVLLPGDAPSFSEEDGNAAGKSGGSDDGSDSGTVALIVGLLLAVSAGGGYLLWRLRPGRAS